MSINRTVLLTGAVVLPFRACRYFAPERGRIQDGADGGRGLRLQTARQCHCLPHRLPVSIASVVFGDNQPCRTCRSCRCGNVQVSSIQYQYRFQCRFGWRCRPNPLRRAGRESSRKVRHVRKVLITAKLERALRASRPTHGRMACCPVVPMNDDPMIPAQGVIRTSSNWATGHPNNGASFQMCKCANV